MTADKAAVVLGVTLKDLTENDISIAFARAVKLAHPDTSTAGSVAELDRAKKARNVLREFVEKGGLPDACSKCNGTGKVAGQWGDKTCPVCNGKGHR